MASTSPKVESNIEEHQASNTVDVVAHHPTGWYNWRLLMYMIIIGLSMGLYGYDNSFGAPLLQLPFFIEKYQGVAISFNARNLDLIVCVPLVGAAIGTFIASLSLERLGRKKTFIIGYFLFCTPGSFLQLFAPNLGALVVGRFWNYLGISMLTTTAPLYLSELVPAHVRGRAIGFCVAGVSAVGVVATTVVWATQKINNERQFQIPLAIQAALPVVLGLLTFIVPESPVWDIQHSKFDDSARRTLMIIRNNKSEIVEAELALYQTAIATETERTKQVRFWDILNRANIKRTLTAGALLSCSQVGGQVLVYTYSTVILVQSGVGNPFQITVIISCLIFLGTLIGPVLVDKFGRRPVALIGLTILLILNIAAGSLAAIGLTTTSRQLGLAAVFIIFGFFNAASFQSLAFVLPTEISTPSLREPTVAWAVFWSYVTAVITTFAIPQLIGAKTASGTPLGAQTAFIFAGCVLLTVIGSYFYLPETRARTMAEVDEMYAIGLPMRKWKGYRCQAVSTTAEKMEPRVSMDEGAHV